MDSLTKTLTTQLDKTITLLAAKGPMEYQALRADATFINEPFVSTSDEAELERVTHDVYGDAVTGPSDEGIAMDEINFGSSLPYITNPY